MQLKDGSSEEECDCKCTKTWCRGGNKRFRDFAVLKYSVVFQNSFVDFYWFARGVFGKVYCVFHLSLAVSILCNIKSLL